MLKQSWKKVYSRTTTNSIPLLQPQHAFGQRNGSECGQVQDWYPNEKMVVILICLNGIYMYLHQDIVLQGVWVLYRINNDEGDETQPLLAFWKDVVSATFLKYWKEGRLSTRHVGLRNISSDVWYNDTKYYQVQSDTGVFKTPSNILQGLFCVNR